MAERLTGVAVTPGLLENGEFVCGSVPF
ncbi:DUF6461 domain-containing protein [Streptomyces sp. UNOC14_S4]